MNVKKINRLSKDGAGIGIELTFADGKSYSIPSKKLRTNCPCASCLEKKGDSSHNNPLSPRKGKSLLNVVTASSEQETNLEKIWLLGNYAIGARWADGHDSGIYTFQYLTQFVSPEGSD